MMERAAVDIVDCLDADLDPSVFGYSAEEGAHSLEIILAIHASHARHGSERCPPRIRAFFIARVRALSLLMEMFACAAQASCRCRWKPPTVPTSFAAADVSCLYI